jgi:hypothetical protein
VATLGGSVLLAINLVVGVDSGALWLTVPAAALALALLRRRRTSAARPPTP